MFEQNAGWNEYYREQEMEQRKKLFDELCMTQPDDGANEYRRFLFQKRYEDEKSSGKPVDRLLFQCVNLMQIGRSHVLLKKSVRKEVLGICRDFLFEEAEALGEAGERALYWEIRNAATRYFTTCLLDSYGRALFGLLKSGDTNRKERMGKDAWDMSEGVTRKLDLGEELRIWNLAVHDAYLSFDTSAEKVWREIEEKEDNKKH